MEDLPSLCGARINYDKYSTDRTKFSVGFASPLGQLLSCNHMYKQFIFIEDAQKTIKQLESKRLRLHSLSAYSRGNATNDFLNEAISQQLQPEGKPLLLQHDLRQHQPGHRGGQRADWHRSVPLLFQVLFKSKDHSGYFHCDQKAGNRWISEECHTIRQQSVWLPDRKVEHPWKQGCQDRSTPVNKEKSTTAKNKNHIESKLQNSIQAAQKRGAVFLNRNFNKPSEGAQKVILLLFGLGAGSICFLLIIQSLKGGNEQKILQVNEITVPENIQSPNGLDLNLEQEYNRILHYKQFPDSLKKNQSSLYDSILVHHPGLPDSIGLLLSELGHHQINE